MVGDWMLKLRERIDHHSRLMPYALSALSDPSAAVQQAALKILDELGAQWEEEHNDDLKVCKWTPAYLTGDKLNLHSPNLKCISPPRAKGGAMHRNCGRCRALTSPSL